MIDTAFNETIKGIIQFKNTTNKKPFQLDLVNDGLETLF